MKVNRREQQEDPRIGWRLGDSGSFRTLSDRPQIVERSHQAAEHLALPIDLKIHSDWENTPPGNWECSVIVELERAR